MPLTGECRLLDITLIHVIGLHAVDVPFSVVLWVVLLQLDVIQNSVMLVRVRALKDDARKSGFARHSCSLSATSRLTSRDPSVQPAIRCATDDQVARDSHRGDHRRFEIVAPVELAGLAIKRHKPTIAGTADDCLTNNRR